jgi:hypothetical protein
MVITLTGIINSDKSVERGENIFMKKGSLRHGYLFILFCLVYDRLIFEG